MKTVLSSASRRIAAILLLLVLLLPFVSPFAATGVEREEATVPARLAGSPDEELITESEAYQYLRGEFLKCRTSVKKLKNKDEIQTDHICVDANISSFNLTQAELDAIFRTLYYSEAELFFLAGNYSISYTSVSGIVKTISAGCIEVAPTPSIDEQLSLFREATQSQLAEFRELTRAIIRKVDPSFSEWEKVAFVHDYVALHYDYDHRAYIEEEKDNAIYDAYGMLTQGIGVCQAYSLLTRYLLRQLGVECECVSSEGLNHEWNIVKIDGHWYHMDVTWDDRDDKGFYGQVSHEFFLSSDAHFYNGVSESRNHRAAWESPVSTDDYKYDGMFETVSTPFVFTSDAIYAISDGSLVTYDPGTERFTELFELGLQWHALGGVWQGTFAGLWYLNGNLYWNGENAVYSYAPGSGATSGTRVDRYVGLRYSIFGMRAEADDRTVTFTLALMRDPNSGTVEKEVRSKGGYVITWQIAGKSYETVCLKDETPHYDGSLELPSNLFDYTFLSWDHTPRAASRDETYVARFRMERNDVTLEGKTLREQYRLIRAAILLLDCSSAGYAGASDRVAELDALAAAYAENVGTVNAAFSQVLFGAD